MDVGGGLPASTNRTLRLCLRTKLLRDRIDRRLRSWPRPRWTGESDERGDGGVDPAPQIARQAGDVVSVEGAAPTRGEAADRHRVNRHPRTRRGKAITARDDSTLRLAPLAQGRPFARRLKLRPAAEATPDG
jgi:hypothetical protein